MLQCDGDGAAVMVAVVATTVTISRHKQEALVPVYSLTGAHQNWKSQKGEGVTALTSAAALIYPLSFLSFSSAQSMANESKWKDSAVWPKQLTSLLSGNKVLRCTRCSRSNSSTGNGAPAGEVRDKEKRVYGSGRKHTSEQCQWTCKVAIRRRLLCTTAITAEDYCPTTRQNYWPALDLHAPALKDTALKECTFFFNYFFFVQHESSQTSLQQQQQ